MSTPAVDRLNAALSGRYRIERELGEGGMATVYLADDLKHERKVALKVLKPELAAVVGAERFLAEIKTTANLQHPHILPLHDSGEVDGFLFYVMPYVEGDTLRQRLDREKQLPVDESVKIATDVADALQTAHEQGVIHRDIKPANILLSRGRPLVADFGIALAVSAAGGGRLTETGLSLGTPHYMSPEQATGDQTVGPTTDIYALGCVLYEMLVGDPPYVGSTAQAVLGKIVTGEPDSVTEHRRSVPANVEGAVNRALEKVPADRFTAAQDFAKALVEPGFRHGALGPVDVPIDSGLWKRLTAVFAATTTLAAVLLGWALFGSSPDTPPIPLRVGAARFEVRAPVEGVGLAIADDGSYVAVTSLKDGVSKLFVRRADEREFREIPGTEGAAHPTFSPDGEWLAFDQEGSIKRVAVSGGPILTVVEGSSPHWALDETLVFARGGGIYQVSPSGGEARLIVEGVDARLPRLLPDGEAVVFQSGFGNFETRHLMVVEIASGVVTDLGGINVNNPRYISTGHVVYGHVLDQALMAVPFDLGSRRTTGTPVTVLSELLVGGRSVPFGVSKTGTAVYGLPTSAGGGSTRLVIVDALGVETPLPLGGGTFRHPRFSPNGGQIVYQGADGIRVYDRGTGENRPLAAEGDTGPWWSRDGRYVYFTCFIRQTESSSEYRGCRRLADGSGEAEPLGRRDYQPLPQSMSHDGTQLLMMEFTPDRGWDLYIMSEDGDSVIFTDYLRADWNETLATISPDGARAAYVSDESGFAEVYVSSFPVAEDRVLVSDGGGTEPVWAPDGSAIYYRNGSSVMRASITTGEVFSVETPREIFQRAMTRSVGFPRTNWDVHADGESFLFVSVQGAEFLEGGGSPVVRLETVVNWFEEVKARMGN